MHWTLRVLCVQAVSKKLFKNSVSEVERVSKEFIIFLMCDEVPHHFRLVLNFSQLNSAKSFFFFEKVKKYIFFLGEAGRDACTGDGGAP